MRMREFENGGLWHIFKHKTKNAVGMEGMVAQVLTWGND